MIVTLVGLTALALALRLPWLGALPNPNGDEGNWVWFGLRALRGRAVVLPPDARFVTPLFAWLIAGAYSVFGVSFAAARAVPVIALTVTVAMVFLLCLRLKLPRAGAVMALSLCVHPWSVAWSRTVTVPYALCLCLGVLAPLVFLIALRDRKTLLFITASLLFGLGAHFSPLSLLPALAAGGMCLTARPRVSLLHTASLSVPALGVALPALVGALGVRAATDTHSLEDYFTALPLRVETFVRAVLGGASGEATLRHFTAVRSSPGGEALSAFVIVLVFALALVSGGESTEREHTESENPERRSLNRWLRWHLGVALVGLPVLLAPARSWNLPAVDAERYLFTVVSPLFFAVALLAERRATVHRFFVCFSLSLWVFNTARGAGDFLYGGGADRGEWLLRDGGAYRGWRMPREREALPVLVRREVERVRGRGRALVVVSDYAFHPLHFTDADGGATVVDIAKFPLPERPGWTHVFVRWSPGLFAENFTPTAWLDRDRALGVLMHRDIFAGLHRVRVFTQPNGTPLCELWVARRRALAER